MESRFDEKTFTTDKIVEIRQTLGGERAVIACSGGVDSTTCAVLTHRAVGDRLVCVFIDTAFMRLGEPEATVERLANPPYSLPIRLVDARNRFLKAVKDLRDAEEKRKAFREAFYRVLSGVAKEEGCRFLVQGTILADIIETVTGVKTQHNVLEQIKINPWEAYGFEVIEPLAALYKQQVRAVARCLGLPPETSERQPFPGPGLSIRVVGEVTPEKLEVEKIVTQVVEDMLRDLGASQYFAATLDSAKESYTKRGEMEEAISRLLGRGGMEFRVEALRDRATGLRGGSRLYGRVILVEVRDERERCLEVPMDVLDGTQREVVGRDETVSRVLYRLTDQRKPGKFVTAIRAVETLDFMTAKVSEVPWETLVGTGASIMERCDSVSAVYYDITPKPPATIEFE
ncbi:MAG: ATP-binding protein [Candidatus Bathyarchaeia archaeon]